MKRKIFMVLFAICAVTLWSQSAKIFFVNLFSEPVDIRLGEENNPVFYMNDVDTFTSSTLLTTTAYGSYKLYFKKSTGSKYYYWIDDNEEVMWLPVESGEIYCIVIGTDGVPNYFGLTGGSSRGPKVCFFNGTYYSLERMEVGDEWNEGTVAYTNNLGPDTITNFVTVSPGDYGIFWMFDGDDMYYYYPDSSGEVQYYSFDNGEYYLFLAGINSNGDPGAILYNISP